MTTIKKHQTKTKTQFVEVQPEANVDFEMLLKKENKPLPLEEAIQVTVRCHRSSGQWFYKDPKGKLVYLDCAILANVTFQTREQSGGGCGPSDYIGIAIGMKLPEGTPITVKTGKVNHLIFDRVEGCFRCSRTQAQIHNVPYLILMEGCTSAYVEE